MLFALISPTQVKLVPGVINEINLEPKDLNLTDWFVLKVRRQNYNRPWQILTNFLYITPNINKILVPIVTMVNYIIQPNDIIDYVQSMSTQEAIECCDSGNVLQTIFKNIFKPKIITFMFR